MRLLILTAVNQHSRLQQPGFTQCRGLLGDGVQLCRGIGVALVVDQDPRIRQAQWHGVVSAGDDLLQQTFGLTAAQGKQFQCQQTGLNGFAVFGGGLFRGVQGFGQLLGSYFHAADGGPTGGCRQRLVHERHQSLLDHCRGQIFVLGLGVNLHEAVDGFHLLGVGAEQNFCAQGHQAFRQLVQGHVDLQHEAVGLARLWKRLLPSFRRFQGRRPRAGVQGNFNRTVEQLGIAGFFGGFQHQGIRSTRFTLGQFQFAQQDHQHRLGIHFRVADDLRCRWCGRLGLRKRMPTQQQQGQPRGDTESGSGREQCVGAVGHLRMIIAASCESLCHARIT